VPIVTPAAELLSWALAYAAAGWPVFPCRAGSKVPATPHGVKDATTDPAQIRAWWQWWPDANVAIACGAPGPDVVDIDTKHGAPGRESLSRLARAGLVRGAGALVRTPTGGQHLYFLGSGQRNSTIAAHGVDFRSSGGYVVAPPSVVDGSPYLLVDSRASTTGVDWQAIRAYLEPPRAPRPAIPQTGAPFGVETLARWVAGRPEGNRNAGLYWAACRAVEGGAADLTPLVAAAVAAGLSEFEAGRTVDSARQRIGGAA
jgi:hypothetical protein